MVKEYELEFVRFYEEEEISNIGKGYDIYRIHAGKKKGSGSLSSNRVLYIGQSKNAQERLDNHDMRSEWKKHLKEDEIILVSVAKIVPRSGTRVTKEERERVEAALIYKIKPELNESKTENFLYKKTIIYVTYVNGEEKKITAP